MDEISRMRKGPSRIECEKQIRRILITEILQNGTNRHFKKASDFISYFESLYPASDSLAKQVQRAVKAMDMPKDDQGFFIIDRTPAQIEQDKMLSDIFSASGAKTLSLEGLVPYFVKMDKAYVDFAMHLISGSSSFTDRYTTMYAANDGIIFYTDNPKKLSQVLVRLGLEEEEDTPLGE